MQFYSRIVTVGAKFIKILFLEISELINNDLMEKIVNFQKENKIKSHVCYWYHGIITKIKNKGRILAMSVQVLKFLSGL